MLLGRKTPNYSIYNLPTPLECAVVFINDLTGREPSHGQLDVERMIASRNLGSLMVRVLDSESVYSKVIKY